MEGARPKKEIRTHSKDIISILPEPILHHILCSLTQEEAIKTCVLSKAWRYVGCTRPKIDLDFVETHTSGDSSAFDPFLQGYHDRNIRLDEFAVRFSFWSEGNEASLVQKWIPMIIQNMCVKTFRLTIDSTRIEFLRRYLEIPAHLFRLPSLIVESDHIQNLSLEGCVFQSSPEVRVSLQSLQILCLNNVYIPEKILNSILSNCPFLEEVSLEDCTGFTRIKIFVNNKSTKLARFCFSNGKNISREVNFEIGDGFPTLGSVEIECCLASFSCEKPFESAHRGRLSLTRVELLSTNSFSCNFTTLYLLNVWIPERILDSILSGKSRFIESVSLFDCKGFKRVKMLSNNLAHFYFRGDDGLARIEIGGDVQNLRTIELERCMLSVSHNKPLECPRLTRLSLTSVKMLESFSCNLHSLEELKLDRFSGIEFNLSSRSMKRLSIHNVKTPFKANIDAPSIVIFDYKGILRQSISFATTSCSDDHLWKSKINLESSSSDHEPCIVIFDYKGILRQSISFATTSSSDDHLWKSKINLESSSSDHEPSHCFNEVYGLLDALRQSEISLELDQIEIRRLWRQLGISSTDNIVGLSEAKRPPVAVEHLRIMRSERNNMHSSADPFLIRLFHMFRPSFVYLSTDMLTNSSTEHRDIVELLFKERETELSYIWQRVLEGASLQALHRNQSEWQPVEYTRFTELCKEDTVEELELRIHLKWRV